jgi:hypothetical protein
VGNTELMERKRAEQVGVTQVNGSNRGRRDSCAGEDVCSNPTIGKKKHLQRPASLEIAR